MPGSLCRSSRSSEVQLGPDDSVEEQLSVLTWGPASRPEDSCAPQVSVSSAYWAWSVEGAGLVWVGVASERQQSGQSSCEGLWGRETKEADPPSP